LSIELNALGHFILPGEDEKAYQARVLKCLEKALCDKDAHKSARHIVEKLYDIDPKWVAITYSKKGLYPWEAACCWADDIPSIQLQPVFEKKETLFGIYNKDEILAHEFVHACRSHLGSNTYEELFAYLVSLHTTRGPMRVFSYLRAILGPLFSSPKEVMAFMGVVLLTIFASFFCMAVSEPNALLWTLFIFSTCAFAAMSLFFFSRLLCRLYRWMRCYKILRKQSTTPLQLMVRLADDEIDTFARMTDETFAYWRKKAIKEFRWGVLLSRYCY